MSTLSFHIIGRFVEISYSWDMAFNLSSKNITMVINNNSSIMQGAFVLISFQNGRNDHHIVFFGKSF